MYNKSTCTEYITYNVASIRHMHVQYEIEGPYLATLMDSMYITLPTDIDIRLCLMTRGHLCMFNQALYPVDNANLVHLCFVYQ